MNLKKKPGDSADPFYITTTLPYINAPLHLGHATEIIRADAVARHQKLRGRDVFFNTGTDEHGMKVYESAQKAGKDVQRYVDEYSALYRKTLEKFGVLSDVHFIRTTDSHHIKAAQEFWIRCDKAGYIYKKPYQAKYCVGCEEEKTDSELIDGKCPEHDRVPELINEENYFFKLSDFGDKLLALYDANHDFIVPAHYLNELREFIKRGLKDFSISRLKSKLSWGIPVPGDESQVMYVWFDALVNYISTLGWPEDEESFKRFWINGTPTQYCGKNNTRFQGLVWQAMLMAAGLPPTRTIVVDGFILSEGGTKMSKTLGNVIDPLDIVEEYGTDALRYFVLREFHPFEDSAVSKEKLKEWYNANLANGLGNLVARVMQIAETYLENPVEITQETVADSDVMQHTENFEFNRAMDLIWERIGHDDALIAMKKPYTGIKANEAHVRDEALSIIKKLVRELYAISIELEPFMPTTSAQIKETIKTHKKPKVPLFPRKE